jgi:hypothetical protein
MAEVNAKALTIKRHGLLSFAVIQGEEWIENEPVADPEALVRRLRQAPSADIFSFARPLPASELSFPFFFEWDNAAVVKLAEFSHWWQSVPQETRKNVRRSQRRGVSVRQVNFDDKLVHGISNLYNETPIRQGRKFWHYRKAFDQVKVANATYLDRSKFIGAFFDDELIGFIKLVMVNNVARIMQILSMEAHADKRPTNALLAKAIGVCCENGATHFVYGKYVYGRKQTSPVTEFKRRNGFEQFNFPRYYVPLTRLGAFAIRCGVHRGLAQLLPESITNLFLGARAAIYRRHLSLKEKLHDAARA